MREPINRSSEKFGVLELSLAMVISGTIGAFVLESGQPPINAVFARCAIGTVAIAIYVWLKNSYSETDFSWTNIASVIVVSLCIVFNWILLFSSYQYAPIGIVTIIYHIQPLLVFIGGTIFYAETLDAGKAGLLGVAFGGVVLIAASNGFGGEEITNGALLGYGFALAAALLYACATLVGKRLTGVPAPMTTLSQMLIGTLILLPLANFSITPTTNKQWFSLISLGIVHSAFMYVLIYSSYKKLTASYIAILSFIYPVVAVLVDYIYFHRPPSMMELIGGSLVILASMTVSVQRARAAKK